MIRSTYRGKLRNYGSGTISIDHKIPDGLANRLKALEEKYAKQFPARTEEIRSLWGKVSDGECDRDSLDALYRVVHGLAGSGATFGFPKISETAKQCECVLLDGIASGELELDVVGPRIDSVLAALEQ